jgi:RES domain-containing protein
MVDNTMDDLFSHLTPSEKQDVFEEYFNRDLESYFTSSVICCDICMSDFVKQWPGAYSQSAALEHWKTIDFINQSRILDDFTGNEIQSLLPGLLCPRCGSSLNDSGFMIYEHPFSLPDDFDDILDEISEIAKKFPFLLLTHPFTKNVYDTIGRTKETVTVSHIKETFYRGRDTTKGKLSLLNDFSYPPQEIVTEGRYNHSGHSMLYLADSKETVWAEIGSPSISLYVAALTIDVKLTVLDLTVKEECESADDETMQTIAASSICAAPRLSTGWNRPEYVFTRFVADCAKSFGFDAIKYGSTKNRHGYNLVLLNSRNDFSTIANLESISLKDSLSESIVS